MKITSFQKIHNKEAVSLTAHLMLNELTSVLSHLKRLHSHSMGRGFSFLIGDNYKSFPEIIMSAEDTIRVLFTAVELIYIGDYVVESEIVFEDPQCKATK